MTKLDIKKYIGVIEMNLIEGIKTIEGNLEKERNNINGELERARELYNIESGYYKQLEFDLKNKWEIIKEQSEEEKNQLIDLFIYNIFNNKKEILTEDITRLNEVIKLMELQKTKIEEESLKSLLGNIINNNALLDILNEKIKLIENYGDYGVEIYPNIFENYKKSREDRNSKAYLLEFKNKKFFKGANLEQPINNMQYALNMNYLKSYLSDSYFKIEIERKTVNDKVEWVIHFVPEEIKKAWYEEK